MPAREDGPQEERHRILAACAELLAGESYAMVTPARIAARAGLSQACFLGHFPTKEAALLALSDLQLERLWKRTGAVLRATEAAEWPARVKAVLRVAFEAILADPLLAKATIVEAPDLGPAVLERYGEAMLGLVPLLREGRASLRDPDGLPPTIEETLAGGVFWSAYERLLAPEAPRLEELLPGALEFVLRPYLGEAAASRWARRGGEGDGSSTRESPVPRC